MAVVMASGRLKVYGRHADGDFDRNRIVDDSDFRVVARKLGISARGFWIEPWVVQVAAFPHPKATLVAMGCAVFRRIWRSGLLDTP